MTGDPGARDVIPELGSVAPGVRYPGCPACPHPWHGLPCQRDTYEPPDYRRCECPSSFTQPPTQEPK